MKRIVPLSELPLSNDFMFGEVMRKERVCTLFLEALLQKKIDHIKYIDKQKDLSDSYLNHGIRLDVYLKDEAGTVYNIEMQTTGRKDLEKRIRYYQSGIDQNTLEKGIHYSELPESFVIFVCSFDYFGRGLAVYERVSHIKGYEDIVYDDGSRVYFLNGQYTHGNADASILEFLDRIRGNDFSGSCQSELMREVQTAVESIRTDKEKEETYMTLAMKMEDVRRDSLQEGIQEGVQKERTRAVLALKSTFPAEKIAEIFSISAEEVQRIFEQDNGTPSN